MLFYVYKSSFMWKEMKLDIKFMDKLQTKSFSPCDRLTLSSYLGSSLLGLIRTLACEYCPEIQ